MKKKILTILTVGIMALSAAAAMTGCDGSSDGGGTRICQFDGCTRKATSAGGEFCSYHSKMLNDYWDAENAAKNYKN